LSSDFAKFHADEASSYRSKSFVLKILKGSFGVSRLGIVVPKKVGNAVMRNKMRRIFREIFRRKLQKYGGVYDYLVLVRQCAPHGEIEAKLLDAATNLHCQISAKSYSP
jgi:ribonuclease P protein component